MLGAVEQRSEIARLRSQIEAEYEAARTGLTEVSSGSAQHASIVKRMNTVMECYGQLEEIIGPTEATLMLVTTLDGSPSSESSSAPCQ